MNDHKIPEKCLPALYKTPMYTEKGCHEWKYKFAWTVFTEKKTAHMLKF